MFTNLKNLENGDFFTFEYILFPNVNQVYIKGDYDRSSKTYSCYCYGDMNKCKSVKGNKVVFTAFIF